MKITQQQVVEWLAKVRLQGSSYNSFLMLNEEQKAKIASVVTQEINQWLHRRPTGEGQ